MTLSEAVDRLGEFDSGDTIYAALPWTENSPAVVAPEPEAGGMPVEATQHGLAYFLEVNVASEFLEDWKRSQARPSAQAMCRRLIAYAVNDA
jgi:hypothetical protein